MTTTESAVVGRCAGTESVEVDDETVIWRQGALHRLDAVGTVVWRLLSVPTRFDDLVDVLREIYGHPAPVIAADLRNLLGRLAESQLVEWRD